MHLMFPPYLNKGSKDLGPSGPVRILQENLGVYFPTLAKEIGLDLDGDYGDKTEFLVKALQDATNAEADLEEPLVCDGNFGPRTRQEAFDYLVGWAVNAEEIAFADGGECMYVAPDSPEPMLWTGETADKGSRDKPEPSIAAEPTSAEITAAVEAAERHLSSSGASD